MPRSQSSLSDRWIGGSIGCLVGAAALFIAVKLIEAVAVALLVIVIVGLFVVIGIAVLRARSHGW